MSRAIDQESNSETRTIHALDDAPREREEARQQLATIEIGPNLEWVRHLLSINDLPGYLGLGVYYWKGLKAIKKPDHNRAYFWTEQAASRQVRTKGVSGIEVRLVAKTQLAYFLFRGIGQARNYQRAEELLTDVVTCTNPDVNRDARFLMAYFWSRVSGIDERSKKRAAQYFKELAEAGYVDAKRELARCYKGGIGFKADVWAADDLHTEIAEMEKAARTKPGIKLKTITSWFPLDDEFNDSEYRKSASDSNLSLEDDAPGWYDSIFKGGGGIATWEGATVQTKVASRSRTREDWKREPERQSGRTVAKIERQPNAAEHDLSMVDMPRWTAFNELLSVQTRVVLLPKAKRLERELQAMEGRVFPTDADAKHFAIQLRERLDELNVRIACLGDNGECRRPSYLAFELWGNSTEMRFKCEHAPAVGGKRYHGDSSRELPRLTLVPAQAHPLRKADLDSPGAAS